MYGIVYRYTNLDTGKSYVGKSTKTLEERHLVHLKLAESNTNKAQTLFYRAIRRYGIEQFVWVVIDSAESKTALNECERHWIKVLNSHLDHGGYNMTHGGDGGPCSEAGRKRISAANLNRQ
jgi:group I intron endonuclease